MGLAGDTIALLGRGRGNLDSFRAVLADLDLELVGRNLPAGASLGERSAALRHHRCPGQWELAALTGVTQPTVVALERRGRGRLSTLERVLVALGAGAYLTPRGRAWAFFAHAGNSSMSEAWETPAALLAALHGVFGRFDLDSCAPRKSRTRVRARVHLVVDIGEQGHQAAHAVDQMPRLARVTGPQQPLWKRGIRLMDAEEGLAVQAADT